jgi:nucleoside-diphosphate-sugar epimerase
LKQPILVLGAEEFVGGKVVQALAAAGWAAPIAGMRRRSASGQGQAEERLVDATSSESVRAALQGVAAVVNCVSDRPRSIVSSAKALFESAVALAAPPPIVHFSSMTVYGSSVGLVDESTPLRGDIGPYSAAHVAAEGIAASYPRVVIFRPGCEFGPGSEYWGARIAGCLLARRLGDLGPAGDGYCNLVDMEDVVAAVLRALASPEPSRRIFNLANPEAPTWNEFLTRYGIALGAVPVRRISRRRLDLEGRLLAPPLKIAEILARACRLDARALAVPIPPSLLRLMKQEIRLDTRRAEADLGLRWKSMDTSLAETARWFLQSRGDQ